MSRESSLGLYIHVPFCASICNYCNFNRGLFDEALKARYVDALVREVHTVSEQEGAGPVDTVYLGGGTPSLLSPHDVTSILTAMRSTFDVDPHAEITLEANPE